MSDDPGTHKLKIEDLHSIPQNLDQDLFSQDEIQGLADLLSDNPQEFPDNRDDTGQYKIEKP